MVAGTIFGRGCVAPAFHLNKGTPRPSNIFGPASNKLHIRTALEIKSEILITSATKLKIQKLRNELI